MLEIYMVQGRKIPKSSVSNLKIESMFVFEASAMCLKMQRSNVIIICQQVKQIRC